MRLNSHIKFAIGFLDNIYTSSFLNHLAGFCHNSVKHKFLAFPVFANGTFIVWNWRDTKERTLISFTRIYLIDYDFIHTPIKEPIKNDVGKYAYGDKLKRVLSYDKFSFSYYAVAV